MTPDLGHPACTCPPRLCAGVPYSLAGMNWRLGLLLTGIHLAVTGSLMVWQETRAWRYFPSKPVLQQPVETETMGPDGEITVSFKFCAEGSNWVGHQSAQEKIVGFENLPVVLLSGWHTPCSTAGMVSWMVEERLHRTRISEIVILSVLCALVAIQWFLVGGFPLIRPRRWWGEPGAFITLCTLAALPFAFIRVIDPVAMILASFAGLAWFWWFGLLVWKTLRSGWRLAGRGIAHLH